MRAAVRQQGVIASTKEGCGAEMSWQMFVNSLLTNILDDLHTSSPRSTHLSPNPPNMALCSVPLYPHSLGAPHAISITSRLVIRSEMATIVHKFVYSVCKAIGILRREVHTEQGSQTPVLRPWSSRFG